MKGQALYKKAKTLIPGGTQLLSKRPEMFLPDNWPSYYKSAKGVEVTDLDGKVYTDISIMGVGACILGYGDVDVDNAVKNALEAGVMCTLNAPEEVELAELMCELHPWANMVRYARSGGEAMSLAIRIARAYTKKDKVAFCGYHGWTDWYLAANLSDDSALDGHLMPGLDPAGVARCLKGSALPFHYNRIDQLKEIIDKNKGEVGVIVMEPQRDNEPVQGFVEEVRQIATDIGAVLIFDEITTGFRMTCGGIHMLMGIEPDIAVFAKAMSNGYAMSAVIGKEKVMQAAQSTFVSSTNWTERLGPAAALATIKKYRKEKVEKHICKIGLSVMDGWHKIGEELGLKVHTEGLPTLNHFGFQYDNEIAMTTLFTQLMLDKGYLAFNQFKPSFAHQEHHIAKYMIAVKEAFAEIADLQKQGKIEKALKGPVARRGFYRLN